MTDTQSHQPLSDREKRLLFWASFLSLTAAGVGFAFRVAKGGEYGAEFDLDQTQIGQVFGASLWPIAVTMILFSLVVDRTGYRLPMFGAFALQAISGVGTAFASDYGMLYFSALCAGLGHGIVEAVINPVCAAVYPKEKTKWLAILHAAWPAGLVLGTLMILGSDAAFGPLNWSTHALWILVPAVPYVLMFLPCRFPVDERVQAGVPFQEMLRQVGFLTAFLASGLMFYEIGNQVFALSGTTPPESWFTYSVVAGLVIGGAFGAAVKSLGQPLFFLMCLLMIPLATTELGTDAWIQGLMAPVLTGYEINPAMALVFSASIMLVLRMFAGSILKFASPPAMLCFSGVLSAVGLMWLSGAGGAAIFIAFALYACGQAYYWPCVLGFTSERYPQGGALTLNTVSAIGLLSVGIVGTPILGSAFDQSIQATVAQEAPALAEAATATKDILWMSYEAIVPEQAAAHLDSLSDADKAAQGAVFEASQVKAGRDGLLFAARFPIVLFLAFGAIALWFRMRGGYKPVELSQASGGGH